MCFVRLKSPNAIGCHRAAATPPMAAFTLVKSKSALGAFFRGQRSHFRAPKPITALAYKLARLVYSMLKHGMAYVDVILLYNTRWA